MFPYVMRVRDLVHGTILFTDVERRIIDNPLFQRLRHIRQNDVVFYVYPSINTSRFEHGLGTCRVAGMMAENLTTSPKWELFQKELSEGTGLSAKGEFVQLCRLYALLHDIGHLPLSHLFEQALEYWWVGTRGIAEEWTGVTGHRKVHEALGSVLIQEVAEPTPSPFRDALVRLMTEKFIPSKDPLSVVKALVDSEIDADRIDFVQRDGLLAGGEYGNYDVRRLCDAAFLEQDLRGWLIAYSEKALTSMEALLLDRYRTHVWIHFHHRVVTLKSLVRYLIQAALERGLIDKSQFMPSNERFPLLDDIWLWSVLRNMDPGDDHTLAMVKRAVFLREKANVLTLWKSRPMYHKLLRQVMEAARVHSIEYSFPELYPDYLSRRLGAHTLVFRVPFDPLSERSVLLYSEADGRLSGETLLGVSVLVSNLEGLWKDEPQRFIVLVGEDVKRNAATLQKKWVKATARWITP